MLSKRKVGGVPHVVARIQLDVVHLNRSFRSQISPKMKPSAKHPGPVSHHFRNASSSDSLDARSAAKSSSLQFITPPATRSAGKPEPRRRHPASRSEEHTSELQSLMSIP